MLFPLRSQTDMKGQAAFHCRKLGQNIPTATCLEWFVDYNALNRKDAPCFKCQQGQQNRELFARS